MVPHINFSGIVANAINQVGLNVEQKEKNDRKIITLGTWENNKKEKKPVKWLVLKEDDNSYFCVSEKLLFCHGLNDNQNKGTDYSNSAIRKYLNNDFYNTCFSEDEKLRVMNHKISGEFSNDVKDYVFLLSADEIESLMPTVEMDETEQEIKLKLGGLWYARKYANIEEFYWYYFKVGIRPAVLIRK